jgi:hypothetical protein
VNPSPTRDAVTAQSAAEFVDTFDTDVAEGAVIDSRSSAGVMRHGIDLEGVIGIDHGALRIRPMIEQGWGRSAITYGPYARRNGLMLATLLLNGHNTSQVEPLPERLSTRLLRWLQGHGDRRSGLIRRVLQWLRYRRKSYIVRKIRAWRHMASGSVAELDENLAVGWFPSADPGDPAVGGNVFVMHAALGGNGELWLSAGSSLLSVACGIQNVPMCYVTVLRETGAAYYLASVPGANGAGAYPVFRPYAIDTVADDVEVYAGVHQAALGQIGFRTDTRVYGMQVAHVDALDSWYGTARAADLLTGSDSLDGRRAESGQSWTTVTGAFACEEDGARPLEDDSLAVLRSDRPSGLVHMVASRSDAGAVGLVWRYRDVDNHCRVEVEVELVRVVQVVDGVAVELASSPITRTGAETSSIQLADDGRSVRVSIDGEAVSTGPIEIEALSTEVGVGIWARGAVHMRRFEAHPSEIDLGGIVGLPSPWFEVGDVLVVADDFGGPAGDLAGRTTTTGDARWSRVYGSGRMVVTGNRSVVVDATRERPNPGNTAYVVDWHHPEFVDVSVDVTPPGEGFGEGHRGRGGLVLYDDPDNFIMISMYVDDSYDGASIAYFSHLDGFEDIYDAVWSMVDKKIYWGATHRLRVVSDGNHLMTFIDDEPVLYRAVTDLYSDRGGLSINAVGLVANWEWGDDTGTVFEHFTASRRSEAK